MRKGQITMRTNEWIMNVANKYNFGFDTVEGIYKEMIRKYPTKAKSKTLEFVHLYRKGQNE